MNKYVDSAFLKCTQIIVTAVNKASKTSELVRPNCCSSWVYLIWHKTKLYKIKTWPTYKITCYYFYFILYRMEKFFSDLKFCDLMPNSLLRNKLSTKFSKMNKICYRCNSIRKFDGFGPACHGHIYSHTVGRICQNSFVSMKSQRLHQIHAGREANIII